MIGHATRDAPRDANLDGTAVAGDLQEVFAADMTTALGTCDGCGLTAVLARARVYSRAPAWSCGAPAAPTCSPTSSGRRTAWCSA